MSVLIIRPYAESNCQLTPSSGSDNSVLVDEVVLDESDYVFSNINTYAFDTYRMTGHSTESGTINGVTVKLKAKYVLTGTCTNNATIKPMVHVSSLYYGTEQSLTNSTAEYSHTWSTNPNTSSAWTWTQIDSLTGGVAAVAGYVDSKNLRQANIFQLWVEVDYGEAAAKSLLLSRRNFKHMIVR